MYNHGNADDNLFRSTENFRYFIKKFKQHMSMILDVNAFCLMPNHFHFLVRIRDHKELIKHFNLESEISSLEKLPGLISRSFGNFLNAYAKAFNKMYDRRGSLFLDNLKRKKVDEVESLCRVVHYIHYNPVHHKFVRQITKWEHSSYLAYLESKETWIAKEEVLSWFGGIDGFKEYHQWAPKLDLELI